MKSNFCALAVCASLVSGALADSDLLFDTGRTLAETKLNRKTDTFSHSYNNEGDILNRAGVCGMVIGFFIFGVFLAYAVIMLVLDDRKRHSDYDNEIKNCKNILMTKYKCTTEEVERMMDDFAANDKKAYFNSH